VHIEDVINLEFVLHFYKIISQECKVSGSSVKY